jgi:nitrite reductase (NO-forming)
MPMQRRWIAIGLLSVLGSVGCHRAIVEFMIPEAGGCIMVDHHFANASQGAVGMISAHAGQGPASTPEHHNIRATAAPTDPVAVQGKLNFETKCLACHTIGGGDRLGPDLHHVTTGREDAWLRRWMKDPEGMLQSGPIGKEMLAKYTIPMPDQNVSDEEIDRYLAYFEWADENLRPQGQVQPQPATPGAAKNPGETYSAPSSAPRPEDAPPRPPGAH